MAQAIASHRTDLLDENDNLSGDPVVPGWEIAIKELFGQS